MQYHKAPLRARYVTQIGHTVKALPKQPALKRGVKAVAIIKPIPKTKAAQLMDWYDQLRTSQMQLIAFTAGVSLREFDEWEFTYVPNMFREATRLLKINKYLAIRLYSYENDIPMNELYKRKGINYNTGRKKENEEIDIVLWALKIFEKRYSK